MSRGPVRFTPQDIYEISSTPKLRLGERLVLGNRTFVYCKAGSNALSAGLLVASPATLTSEDTVTVAHPIGTTKVRVTASGITANQWAEGLLVVDEGTGAGESYRIKGNSATDSNGLVTVELYDGLATAWSTSDTDVTIIPSEYSGVITMPTDGAALVVGVPLVAVTANYYFWAQCWGPCGVKVDAGDGGGNAVDERLGIPSPNHAGQIYFPDTPAAGKQVVARAMLDSADYNDDKFEPVYLIISK